MRSEKINPLFSSISSLSGVGPKLEILFNRLVGDKLIHLLWHIPYNAIKRNRCKRRLRAVANIILPSYSKEAHDYVLIARTECLNRNFNQKILF